MKKGYLKSLTSATKILLKNPELKKISQHLKTELQHSKEPFLWKALEIKALRDKLPSEIQSAWVFVLKKNTPSVSHYHPNSIQHTVVLEGQGKAKIGWQWKDLTLFDPDKIESWCIIDKNMPHEFFPRKQDMTVLSFHTCSSHELLEIKISGGKERTYKTNPKTFRAISGSL